MDICVFYYNKRFTISSYQRWQLKRIAIKITAIVTAITISNGILPIPVFAAGAAEVISKGDTLKNVAWSIVLVAAKITFLAYGGKEVITNIINGALKDAVKVLIKYLVGYYILINFPKALTLMENL